MSTLVRYEVVDASPSSRSTILRSTRSARRVGKRSTRPSRVRWPTRQRRDRPDRRRQHVRRRRRHQDLQHAEDARAVARAFGRPCTPLKRIEDAAKPLVAAIHGHALGGGLELAMACHYRVATPTQRSASPRCCSASFPAPAARSGCPALCGAALALEMCTDGKPVAADAGAPAGIIDHIVDGDLLRRRHRLRAGPRRRGERRRTRDLAGQDRRSRRRPRRLPGSARSARQDGARGARAVRGGRRDRGRPARMDFDAGSRRERELFADCVVSTESKALVTCSSPSARPPRFRTCRRTRPPATIARAAVVGAGTMGGGIAMTYANAGIPVLLKDVDQARSTAAWPTIRRNYESSVAKGTDDAGGDGAHAGAHHADDELRRLRCRRHRRRGGVREHGAEESHVRRARRGRRGPTASWRPTPPRSTSTSSRRRAAGRRRSSGTTSSARRT